MHIQMKSNNLTQDQQIGMGLMFVGMDIFCTEGKITKSILKAASLINSGADEIE